MSDIAESSPVESSHKTEKAVFRIQIDGRIEDVWHEITKTDEAQGAFFNAWMHVDDFKPGATIQMRTKSGKYVIVIGKILEFDPPHRFSHTMRFTQFDDPECTVIYQLQEKDGGVEFTLTIPDLPVGTKSGKQMNTGGNWICKSLKAIVETGRPPLGTRMLYGLFGLMEPLSPKRTRVENWN